MKGWNYSDLLTAATERTFTDDTFLRDPSMSENNIHTPANCDTLAPLECQEAVDTFPDYIDGELSSTTRNNLEHHLLVCTECRQSFAAYKLVIDTASELGRESDIKPLEIGVQNRLREALNQRLGIKLSYIA